MDSYAIIVTCFGVLVLGILCLLFFVNRLLILKKRIQIRFSSIYTYLEERVVILKKMNDFIKQNTDHEEELSKKIEQQIEEIQQIKKPNDGVELIKKSKSFIIELQKLDEVYSQFSKKKEYQKLKEELKVNQERIDYAFVSYDEGVKNYNEYRENPFILHICKVLRFSDYIYYNK